MAGFFTHICTEAPFEKAVFPPEDEDGKYIVVPYFWAPEETIPQRVKQASVPYDVWEKQGFLMAAQGNVVDYSRIQQLYRGMR